MAKVATQVTTRQLQRHRDALLARLWELSRRVDALIEKKDREKEEEAREAKPAQEGQEGQETAPPAGPSAAQGQETEGRPEKEGPESSGSAGVVDREEKGGAGPVGPVPAEQATAGGPVRGAEEEKEEMSEEVWTRWRAEFASRVQVRGEGGRARAVNTKSLVLMKFQLIDPHPRALVSALFSWRPC